MLCGEKFYTKIGGGENIQKEIYDTKTFEKRKQEIMCNKFEKYEQATNNKEM